MIYGNSRVIIGLIVPGLVLLLGGMGSLASETNVQETVITSQSLMFDYGRSTCVFEGNVVVKDPRVQLECETLYVFFDATNNVDSVVATEAVHVKQGNKRGTCDKAVYTAETGAIVMTGNAILRRGRDSVQGDEITIYVNSEKVICKPGRLVVFPSSGTDGETSLVP